MNELKIFENTEFGQVRTMEENGNILFCGSDVAEALGYSNTRKALIDHCKGVTKRDTLTKGGKQKLSFIFEGDLYRLIVHSKLPSAEKFEKWVFEEVLPSIRKTGAYISPSNKDKQTEIKMMNAKVRMSNQFLKLANVETISKEYKQVLVSKATEVLVGVPIIPLPEVGEKTYSATEIGNMLGVTANKIGKIANKHNLKTDEYGKWFHDKSAHSKKEVETFRYYEKAIGVFRGLIEKTA